VKAGERREVMDRASQEGLSQLLKRHVSGRCNSKRDFLTWSLRMRSSMVPLMKKRVTWMGLYWPSLWMRSCACCSTAGFHLSPSAAVRHHIPPHTMATPSNDP
jgi:hypothetical protein